MGWISCRHLARLVSSSSCNSLRNMRLWIAFSGGLIALADAPCGASLALSVPPVVPSFPSLASLCLLDPADQLPLPSLSQVMPCRAPCWPAPPPRSVAILSHWPRAKLCWQVSKLSAYLKLSNKVGLFFLYNISSRPSFWKFSTLLMLSEPGKQTIRSFLKHFILQWEPGKGIWVGAVFLTTETHCKIPFTCQMSTGISWETIFLCLEVILRVFN